MKRVLEVGDTPELPKKKILDVTMVYGSQETEPMDVDTSLSYIDHIKNSYEKKNYPASYLLTDIGNKLLLTAEAKFHKIDDPLTFMVEKLEKNLALHEKAKLGIIVCKHRGILQKIVDNSKGIDQNIIEGLNEIIKTAEELSGVIEERLIEDKINSISIELKGIEDLISDREELNKKLVNAFPFAQKRLTKTFIDKWQTTVENDQTEQEIYAQLQTLSEEIEHTRLNFSINEFRGNVLKVFNCEDNKIAKQNRYAAKTVNSLKEKIEKVIGRSPEENEIKKYLKSHPEMESEGVEEITAEVRGYIADNSDKILRTMQGISRYMLNPDYLKMLRETDDFLFQTFAYRHMSRDLQKVVLVEGNAEQRVIPPGINTVIKITAGGSATVLLGELGSYKNIGETNTATLANYQNYFCNNAAPEEKEASFRSLHQIEAIRSSSALLTNAMFFELAEAKFAPKRPCPEGGWQYSFDKIATHMPMAMQGAVSGAIFLNDAFNELLTSSLPYDYRFEGDKNNAGVLHSKNNNILFDFLLWKSGINYLTLEEIRTNYEDVHTENVSIDDITHSFKTFNLDSGYNITYELLPPIRHEEDVESHEFNNFIVTAIHSFPADVLNELLDNWYGTECETEDGTVKHTDINDLFLNEMIELSPPIKIMGDCVNYVELPDTTD